LGSNTDDRTSNPYAIAIVHEEDEAEEDQAVNNQREQQIREANR
jgi:hypothetical protein